MTKLHLKAEEIHIPARGGVMLDRQMPMGKPWPVKYPVMLNAQFILARQGQRWTQVGTRYLPLHFIQLTIERVNDGFDISWDSYPWSGYKDKEPPQPSLTEFGSMAEAVEDYREWMAATHSLREKTKNPELPDWVRNVRLFLIVDMWGSDDVILADYDDVIHLIDDLDRIPAPRDTVLYLPGWSNRWDAGYPEYNPAERLGGPVKFRQMVNRARASSYRIMPSTNVLGCAYDIPDFERFKPYQITDRAGRKCGWGERGQPCVTTPFAYMRPCAKPWRVHLLDKLEHLVKTYDLEALYLDQTLLIIDDPQCNMEEGLNTLIAEAKARFPGVLIAGEGCHERIIRSVSFCQIHGAPWTMGVGSLSYEKDSLIFQELFGDYAYFCGHISIPTAFVGGRQVGIIQDLMREYWEEFWMRDDGFEKVRKYHDFRGVIRTLRINYKDHGLDPTTRTLIAELA